MTLENKKDVPQKENQINIQDLSRTQEMNYNCFDPFGEQKTNNNNIINDIKEKSNTDIENSSKIKLSDLCDCTYEEEKLKKVLLKTISMNDLHDRVFENNKAIIDKFLYPGIYIIAGAPKVGKSFLMAQIAYHISTGKDLWSYKVNQGQVLYLALEDDYSRLQRRLYRMFGVEVTQNLFFAITAGKLSDGLEEQLQGFITRNPKTKLIIIDTLQKIRFNSNENLSYAKDYEVINKLKKFADYNKVCVLIVHHTRKQKSEDNFEMISGTNGLMGAADGALILKKEKRTGNEATLEISGKDLQEQKLYLCKNPESLLWGQWSEIS